RWGLLRLQFSRTSLRIEEFAGGGDRLGCGVLIFLARRDVFATVDALRLVRASRHGHGNANLDFRMHGDGDPVLADGLDRRVEQDLAAADRDAVALQRGNDVANADRTEQLTAFGRLANDDHAAAVDLFRDLGCLGLGLQVARLEFGLHAVEFGTVVGGRPQGLAALEQKVAGKAVP